MAVKYYDWLDQHESVRPDKVAIQDLDAGVSLTYSELNARARALAGFLQTKGINKGDRVALLVRNRPEFFEAQFACAKIGAICLPLNWRLTVNELKYILEDSSPDVLIHDYVFADTANNLVAQLKTRISLELAEPMEASSYDCLLYTSPSPRDLSTSRMPSSA